MGAATFEIVITGTLGPAIAGAFEGFTVSRVEHGRTHLVGPIDDQARLHGLLELLASLNIELVSVNPISPRGAA
ncbi:hypothetical protein [Leifsonia poae]|uniref:Uncharacterized protein n=1 Tax=Leifsonia poae TaxID=110933 RepID=A0A9W6HD23_9MICO|nr:hypothetical protein [Leifsonia poae]GLJ77682.1 hypothetical protein GCM10017584_32560 [Leifsonia poae]